MTKSSRPKTWTAAITAVATFCSLALGEQVLGKTAGNLINIIWVEPVHSVIGSVEPGRPFEVMVPVRPTDLTQVKLPNEGDAIMQWADIAGGGAADEIMIEVSLWGQRDRPLFLRSVRAKIQKCTTPPAWTYLSLGQSGIAPPHLMTINLDDADAAGPLAQEQEGESGSWRLSDLYITSYSPERLNIDITSTRQSCSFNLVLEYLDDGKVKTSKIPDHGPAFRVIPKSAASATMQWKIDGDEVTLSK